MANPMPNIAEEKRIEEIELKLKAILPLVKKMEPITPGLVPFFGAVHSQRDLSDLDFLLRICKERDAELRRLQAEFLGDPDAIREMGTDQQIIFAHQREIEDLKNAVIMLKLNHAAEMDERGKEIERLKKELEEMLIQAKAFGWKNSIGEKRICEMIGKEYTEYGYSGHP